MSSKTIKLWSSFVFAAVIAVILLVVLFPLKDSLTWLSVALGLAAGWGAGILLAPYRSEKDQFREYAKLVSGFITGYLVTKVDRLVDLWFDPAHGPLFLNPLFVHRVLACITAFLLAMVSTYVARKYLSFGPGAEQPPDSK